MDRRYFLRLAAGVPLVAASTQFPRLPELVAEPAITGASSARRRTTQAAMTAFANVTVVPMRTEEVLRGHTVLVEGDRIIEVAPSTTLAVPPGATVVDGTGQFLAPGLANMHFHVAGQPNTLVQAVANGQTTVQAMNATPVEVAFAEEIRAGTRFGPSIITGPHAGGLPDDLLYGIDRLDRAAAPHLSLARFLDLVSEGKGFQIDEASGRAFVGWLDALGGDFVKTNLFVSRTAFDAMIEGTRGTSVKLQGHVWGDIGLEHYIESGAHIHHFTEVAPYLSREAAQGIPLQRYDFLEADERIPQVAELMARHDSWFTPTAVMGWFMGQLYRDPDAITARPQLRWAEPASVRGWSSRNLLYANLGQPSPENTAFAEQMGEVQEQLIRELHASGVRLLAGSDASAAPWSVQGFELPREIELFVEYGLSPFEALTTATRGPAEFWAQEAEWGTIEVGKRADLVLLRRNPLDDISAIREIAGVMLRGEWLPKATLDEMLEEIATAYEAEANLTLEPIEQPSHHYVGVVPGGWTEIEDGVWTRSNPGTDPTFFIQTSGESASAPELLGGVLQQMGASAADVGDPIDRLELNGLTWSLHRVESGLVLMFATAEADGRTYVVAVASTPDQIDGLVESLLRPAVGAFTLSD